MSRDVVLACHFWRKRGKQKRDKKNPRSSFCLCQKGQKKKKKKERDPPVGRTKGNSCKESTRHPNIRRIHRHKVSGAHEVARCDCHVHAATGLHPPPRRDAISAIFTRKASRPIPAARSSNKACYTPRYTHGLRACIATRAYEGGCV